MIKQLFGKLGRKYTTAMLNALLIICNKAFDLGLDAETIWQVTLISATWILGESSIDTASAIGEKKAKVEAAPIVPPADPPAPPSAG